MPRLEAGELGMCAGEFAGEPLVEVPQPDHARLTRVRLLPSSPGSCSTLLELVLEVAPSPVESCAGDPRLSCERLDVTGPASRDLPGQQPVDGCPDAPFSLFTLVLAQRRAIVKTCGSRRSCCGWAWRRDPSGLEISSAATSDRLKIAAWTGSR